MDPLTAAGTALGMGSIACPIDPRCGVTGRQTRLAPVSERATGAGNHGEIPSCACLMGNLIGKFIIMVKWGIEWGISYLTVETTVCLKDQAIGRCRFWFKELTDEQCLCQVSILGPSEWRHLVHCVQRLGGAVSSLTSGQGHSGEPRGGCCTGGAGAAVARCWGLPCTGGCGTCTPAHPGAGNWKCRRRAGHSRPGSQVSGQP